MFDWLLRKFEKNRAKLQNVLESTQVQTPLTKANTGLKKQSEEPSDWRAQGNAFIDSGQLALAETCFQKAVLAHPHNAQALISLGYVQLEQNKLQVARDTLTQSLRLDNSSYDAHYMLGSIEHKLGDLSRAIASYQNALTIQYDFKDCNRDLCIALAQAGQTTAARKLLDTGRGFETNTAPYHFFSGKLYLGEGDYEKSVADFARATVLNPQDAETLNNYGLALFKQGDVYAAIESFKKGLILAPSDAQMLCNLGAAYQITGAQDIAISHYRQALVIDPDFNHAHDNLLYALSFSQSCTPENYVLAAKNYGRSASARARPFSSWLCPPIHADRPLRIGIVSGDLRSHVAGAFIESVAAFVDHSKLSLVAYSTALKEDTVTARLRHFFTEWNPVAALSDEAIANKIHTDKIDILVDLAGHTANNRLTVFAWRAAPKQVSWLGYWASTGVAEMDYVLADPVSVPESAKSNFCEKIWHLPNTRLCFSVPQLECEVNVAQLPAIQNGHVTFGSFQLHSKLNEASLQLWAKVLAQIPSARLRIQNMQLGFPRAKEDLFKRMTALGMDINRVALHGGGSRLAYLEAYQEVDIVLDTFPFPGGTTTAEALWMGVPTISLSGQTMIGRQGESFLRCVGLGDWVAADASEYVAIAVAHTSDLHRLQKLREGLRAQVLVSPLMDASAFACNLESAFEGIAKASTP